MSNRMYSFIVVAVLFAAMLQGCLGEKKTTVSTSESGNIIVSQPQPNDRVDSPVTVTGKARVFEAALSARVLAPDGRQLGIVHMMASQGAPEFGSFSGKISFTRPAGVEQGIVEVFSDSAKDGSPINIVRIPVLFRTD